MVDIIANIVKLVFWGTLGILSIRCGCRGFTATGFRWGPKHITGIAGKIVGVIYVAIGLLLLGLGYTLGFGREHW